jgi:hypothetical protein
LQQIGEGGMGVVFMAEQTEPVRRKFALKIIKPGLDSKQVISRFEAERQALALMDHQYIARVLDAGTTLEGRPYFVMELVPGVPITKFCDAGQLTLRTRLELFVPACQAIQHAHQKGIIHRDIKPSNVLVTMYDDKPVPKVIDFGVAKAIEQRLTEKTMFTQYGALVGTFEYMSPEQAETNAFGVDTRSDIYSLGVLLYELLAGTTPLERKRVGQAALEELLRLIKEEEPPWPSVRLSSSHNLQKIAAARKTEPARLSRLVRGELDWIVMKCLEKDRTRRYESASGLARDVERYLHDEPVEACPPSVGYRLRKFGRKNRALLTTAAAFAALLLLATGVSLWLAGLAHRAEAVATERRQVAEEAAKRATEQANRADQEAIRAKASDAEARRSLDRMSVEKGLRLAEEGDLFTALLWFVRPLERGGLSPEEERIHRLRFVSFLRHTQGRPLLRHMLFNPETPRPSDSRSTYRKRQLEFSADMKRLLVVGWASVNLWDLETGKRIATLRETDRVRSFQFINAGNLISGYVEPGSRLWNGMTGELVTRVESDPERVAPYCLPVGLPLSLTEMLASLAVRELQGAAINGGWLISPDGRRRLSWQGKYVSLWDQARPKLLRTWVIPEPPALDEN